ncbi:MAG: phosphate transport system regulatory protein PhoU [Planctomycetes bacterium RBG_16_64_12]|nr:MAG: phosphate transport system regulatory protein PhoU [Planctomycetes bacterium RBG_16_64_12]
MSVHLRRQIDRVKQDLLSLGALVEEQVQTAVRALLERDPDLAREVERRDAEVDRREVEVEEECLKTLALYQPVASDLRFVVATLKINNDLERIGDLAVNIAHKATLFSQEPPLDLAVDVAEVWQKTQAMLRDSLNALVNMEVGLAHSVCMRDDEVDRMKHQIREQAEELIGQHPERARALIRLMAVTRNLERIADCATNVAEDVIYLAEAKIVRHAAEP